MSRPARKNIILVHGAGVYHGRSNLFALRKPLEVFGANVEEFRYGLVLVLWGWWRTKNGSKALAKLLQPFDIVVTHSNGVLVADGAMSERMKSAIPPGVRLVALSPACASDRIFAQGWDRVDVIYNPGDNLSWFADHIPWHPWGDMMSTGILDRPLQSYEHQFSTVEILKVNVDVEHGEYLREPYINRFARGLWEKVLSPCTPK